MKHAPPPTTVFNLKVAYDEIIWNRKTRMDLHEPYPGPQYLLTQMFCHRVSYSQGRISWIHGLG